MRLVPDDLGAAVLPAAMSRDAERQHKAGERADAAGYRETAQNDDSRMLEGGEFGLGRHAEKAVGESVDHAERVARNDVVPHPTQPYAITRNGATAAGWKLADDDPE